MWGGFAWKEGGGVGGGIRPPLVWYIYISAYYIACMYVSTVGGKFLINSTLDAYFSKTIIRPN